VFRAASFAAARAYGLEDRGAVAPGFLADFCLVQPRDGRSWRSGLTVQSVYKRGRKVEPAVLEAAACAGRASAVLSSSGPNMKLAPCKSEDFAVMSSAVRQQEVRVIGVRRRQIVTDLLTATLPVLEGQVCMDPSQDILKIAVFE